MIFVPILWFFGVIAFVGVLLATILAALLTAFIAYKIYKLLNRHEKSSKSGRRGFYAVTIVTIVLTVSIFVGSFVVIGNVMNWMSELGIMDDYLVYPESEQWTVWNQFHPFRYNTRTVSADFEPYITISDNFPRLDGATAFLPVYSAVAETLFTGLDEYSVHPYVRLSTTRQAFTRLMQGQTDIIFTLQPSQAQVEDAQSRGVTFIKTPIFREAFVFFVNDINPVTSLTVEQIQQIYAGVITNWSSVGGHNERIVAYQRNPNSGSQTIMEQVVMDGLTMVAPATELRQGDMGIMLRSVAQYTNHRQALGYSFRFYATVMNPQDGLRVLGIDGIEPTPENIANGSYPFTVYVYAITTAQGLENPNTQKVIDWLLSEQGQLLIEKAGYIGLTNP